MLVLRTTQKEVLGRWSRPYLVECRLKDGLELLRSYGEFDLVMCGEERPFRTSSDPLLLKTTTMREEAGRWVGAAAAAATTASIPDYNDDDCCYMTHQQAIKAMIDLFRRLLSRERLERPGGQSRRVARPIHRHQCRRDCRRKRLSRHTT